MYCAEETHFVQNMHFVQQFGGCHNPTVGHV